MFCIQASNPRFQKAMDLHDSCLMEAMETIFPLNTENAILTQNYVSVPLPYKYDVSYMINDILELIMAIQAVNDGQMLIQWLPDTFRCNWKIEWRDNTVQIFSRWENTVGHLENILNEKNYISMYINNFISEWKQILAIIIEGLEFCGYNRTRIVDMDKLLEVYGSIKGNGLLYEENGTEKVVNSNALYRQTTVQLL